LYDSFLNQRKYFELYEGNSTFIETSIRICFQTKNKNVSLVGVIVNVTATELLQNNKYVQILNQNNERERERERDFIKKKYKKTTKQNKQTNNNKNKKQMCYNYKKMK
jgi:hypothetical protein